MFRYFSETPGKTKLLPLPVISCASSAVVLLVLALSGCGGDSTENPTAVAGSLQPSQTTTDGSASPSVGVPPSDAGSSQSPISSMRPVPAGDDAKPVCDSYKGPALNSLKHTEGLMHEHSSYSDGDPGAIPFTYYEAAKKAGYGFVGGSEHSDTYDTLAYFSVHDSCTLGLTDPQSLAGKISPQYFSSVINTAQLCFASPTADKLMKWESTLTQAVKSSNKDFLAIRGFEWTSDVYGHINVFFSKNFSNAKTDGGYLVTMETFWDWFTRDPGLPGLGGSPTSTVPMGGGADGLGVFNHPGDKCLFEPGSPEPTGTIKSLCNWNQFATAGIADALRPLDFKEIRRRMFGMELYNDANRGDRYQPFYNQALDKGWYLSPTGSEDEHHGDYASERRPKTVTLTAAFTEPAFREAWLARRTYALSPGVHMRVNQLADNAHPMGSRMICDASRKTVPLFVQAMQKDGAESEFVYKLFTNTGKQAGMITGKSANFDLPIEKDKERYYYVVVWDKANKGSLVYAAPVWITGR